MNTARIDVVARPDGGRNIELSGRWTLAAIAGEAERLRRELAGVGADPSASWNCTRVSAFDSAGAMLLWRVWGHRQPDLLLARPEHLRVFDRIGAAERAAPAPAVPISPLAWVMRIGAAAIGFARHVVDFIALLGQMLLCIGHVLRAPADLPRREISANLHKGGVLAMPVTALVGFLIGIVLSYLSALQLKQFGADLFIVNILGMGLIRELGPVLVAVLVAGRSGSAMTAQLGVMRVTEEIDALSTMGVSRTLRLVFPKVAALAVAMPLLVLWTTAIALVGGMVAAQLQLDISYGFFIHQLPKAVPAANVWIALSKGVAFGIIVALVACHFGLRVRPNTESLSLNTTASVVTAITMVILVDAVFAIFTRGIGMPTL